MKTWNMELLQLKRDRFQIFIELFQRKMKLSQAKILFQSKRDPFKQPWNFLAQNETFPKKKVFLTHNPFRQAWTSTEDETFQRKNTCFDSKRPFYWRRNGPFFNARGSFYQA